MQNGVGRSSSFSPFPASASTEVVYNGSALAPSIALARIDTAKGLSGQLATCIPRTVQNRLFRVNNYSDRQH